MYLMVSLILVLIIFFIFDAFPIVILGWYRKGGALIVFGKHIHHSTLGIVGVIAYFIGNYFIFFPEIFSVGLGVCLWFILFQLHEIFYFKTLFFPDRKFPLYIKLHLRK